MVKIFIIALFNSIILYSQNDRTFIFGKTIDGLGSLENAHILNLNTNKATNSNSKGSFKILARINDSIKISHIGYKTQIVAVKATFFGMNGKIINLKRETIFLDEVELKKHDLIGSLAIDLKNTPKNRDKKITFNLKGMIGAIMQMPLGKDELHLQKATAPGVPNSFIGAGGSMSVPDYHGIKKRKIRKIIKFKEDFPNKLLSEFGEHFFFVELKIPKEKYFHFLDYCNNTNQIEKLYKENKKMILIALIQKESKSYLSLKNKK